MTNDVPAQPSSDRRSTVALHATCMLHQGPAGFANLVVRKLNGVIEFDPHVTGSCVIRLDEAVARQLLEVLGKWLG
ncbi:MAG: hypothetical protein JO281_06455 [Pseudonocardiales bacterium]|nr:hypothetical protein [Pseudonocardiales bacterium]